MKSMQFQLAADPSYYLAAESASPGAPLVFTNSKSIDKKLKTWTYISHPKTLTYYFNVILQSTLDNGQIGDDTLCWSLDQNSSQGLVNMVLGKAYTSKYLYGIGAGNIEPKTLYDIKIYLFYPSVPPKAIGVTLNEALPGSDGTLWPVLCGNLDPNTNNWINQKAYLFNLLVS